MVNTLSTREITQRQVAKQLMITLGSVRRYVDLFRQTGQLEWRDSTGKRLSGGTLRYTVPPHVEDAAWILLDNDPTLYLDELRDLLNAPPVSAGMEIKGVWRLLQHMKITRQM
jgi:transposase